MQEERGTVDGLDEEVRGMIITESIRAWVRNHDLQDTLRLMGSGEVIVFIAEEMTTADSMTATYNRPCYGYRANEEKEIEIVPDEAAVVREIYSLYIKGLSVVKIKQYLESMSVLSPTGKRIWSKHTIESILTNKKYIGNSVAYQTYREGYPYPKTIVNRGQRAKIEVSEQHVPIIPMEIFEAAQKIRQERTNIDRDEEGRAHRKTKKYSAAKMDGTIQLVEEE